MRQLDIACIYRLKCYEINSKLDKRSVSQLISILSNHSIIVYCMLEEGERVTIRRNIMKLIIYSRSEVVKYHVVEDRSVISLSRKNKHITIEI